MTSKWYIGLIHDTMCIMTGLDDDTCNVMTLTFHISRPSHPIYNESLPLSNEHRLVHTEPMSRLSCVGYWPFRKTTPL